MSIIVLHKQSNKKYILLGTGYGAYMAKRPGFIGGNLFPHEESGEIPVAAVCDENGSIKWIYTEELEVLEIDGQEISTFKDRLRREDNKDEQEWEYEHCPGCNERLDPDQQHDECPSCGLAI